MMAVLSAVLTPLVGSSSRMISGRSAKAEATSRSFLSPWGSCRASACALVGEPEQLGDLERLPSCTWRSPRERGEEARAAAEPGDDRGLRASRAR